MLGPCSSCRRHVRQDERACPFCGSVIAAHVIVPASSARLSRAALFAFTTLGVAVAGCPKTKERDPETIMQPYGAPPRPEPEHPDTGVDAPNASQDAQKPQ